MKTKMWLTAAVFGAVAIAGTAGRASAQSVGAHLGYNIDAQELHLGALGQFTLPAKIGTTQLIASPGIDIYPFIGSGVTMLHLYFDLLYPFVTPSPVTPYAGAGLTIGYVSSSGTIPGVGTFSVSSTDLFLNLKGGVLFMKGQSLRPFAEGVIVIGSGSTLLLRGGVQFSVGKKR